MKVQVLDSGAKGNVIHIINSILSPLYLVKLEETEEVNLYDSWEVRVMEDLKNETN